jgi:exodeoxyribonuclease V gamma subunit
MTLKLYTGNRLEVLAAAMAEVLKKPVSSVLDKEILVVQSKGMERWLSMQLAGAHGICANYRFPFPNTFIHEMFRNVIPDIPEYSSFDPKIMTWRIMKLLPRCIKDPEFENLKFYLGDMRDDLKRFQLSGRIADTFDQYLLFRPEMIFEWEQGKESHWQAQLWRQLVKGAEGRHRAQLGKAFLDIVRRSSGSIEGLPERVSVFGISALPRFHIQVLGAISSFTHVNLFLMNPCKEYWGDIVSDWEIKKRTSMRKPKDWKSEELYLEKGNSLLASMGILGRDFFDLVNELDCEEFPFFQAPDANNLLSCIQSDILDLRDRGPQSDNKDVISPDDTSIQIHSCHSPMREVEVLYDRFLDMFERDPGLLPKDILVMTPDIETYAPYIQAVFDTPPDDPGRIPFSISDRSIKKEGEIVDTFLAILDLYGSRFTAPQVFSILESPAVQRKFGFSGPDLDLIRKWVTDTRIRWGIDGENRRRLDLPATMENTWKAGLERLLLGYAMPGQGENMFNGVLPYDHIEGNETSVLGSFLEFTDQLFAHVASLGKPRTLDKWCRILPELIESFFVPDEDTEREMQAIRRVINDLDLTSMSEGSVFDEEVDIKVIKWHLSHCLEREVFGIGFITGGVTFCAMLPMRSIPFKIICLLGMNSDAYPRQSNPVSFDLMAEHPKPGDRSRRNDDRYLFLEAILSAREKLYISYVGQSIRDNSLIPPSALVGELMDYIEQGFTVKGGQVSGRIVTRHRLQAFCPEYFKKGDKLFSYSEENFLAAQCTLEDCKIPVPFISGGLSDPEETWKTVDLDDLCAFFGNPSRFLLKKRLGMHLDERASIMEEREAFDIKGLEKYFIEEKLIKRKLAGDSLKDFFPFIKASGQLPHGTLGECIYENLSRGVEDFADSLTPYIRGKNLEPFDVDLRLQGFRITGKIDAVYTGGLLHYRYARIKAKDRLNIWIRHLALNTLRTDEIPRTSVLVGLNAKDQWTALEYSPVAKSEEVLETLLREYWAGLMHPLHFFPESSWVYVHMFLKNGKPREDALRSACNIWASDYGRGEREDPYYQLCFSNTDPLDSDFQSLSEEVFRPVLEHQREI